MFSELSILMATMEAFKLKLCQLDFLVESRLKKKNGINIYLSNNNFVAFLKNLRHHIFVLRLSDL
jgi:hypothetical protein